MPKKYNCECIVLKNINYKDTDKIYTFYSKEHGKFIATVKGVRKISSRRGGSLDTLNHVVLGISEDKRGYKYINDVLSKNSFINLKSDLDYSAKAYYILELINRLTQDNHSDYELYELLLKTLRLLDAQKLPSTLLLSYFQLSLMKVLGYGLVLDSCTSCGKKDVLEWNRHFIDIDEGGLICDSCSIVGYKLSKIDIKHILILNKGKLPSGFVDNRNVNELMAIYTQYVVEDTIKTVSIYGQHLS